MFELHPQLAADTAHLADLPLCRVLLMNDSQYPWLILVPRQLEVREVYQLNETQQQQLHSETSQTGEAMMREFGGDKLNLAALGNMVPQLHIHVIVRFQSDPAWPKPVWGQGPAVPYRGDELSRTKSQIRRLLRDTFPAESIRMPAQN